MLFRRFRHHVDVFHARDACLPPNRVLNRDRQLTECGLPRAFSRRPGRDRIVRLDQGSGVRNVERLGVATFASPNFIDLNAIACDSLNGSDSASSDLFINGPLHQLRQILNSTCSAARLVGVPPAKIAAAARIDKLEIFIELKLIMVWSTSDG